MTKLNGCGVFLATFKRIVRINYLNNYLLFLIRIIKNTIKLKFVNLKNI